MVNKQMLKFMQNQRSPAVHRPIMYLHLFPHFHKRLETISARKIEQNIIPSFYKNVWVNIDFKLCTNILQRRDKLQVDWDFLLKYVFICIYLEMDT